MQTEEKVWTLKEILKWTAGYFQRNSIELAQLEAEELCAHVLNCNRLDIFLKLDTALDEAKRSRLRELVVKRGRERLPLAYLLGNAEFMGLKILVNPAVLIPRPETELLVERTIELLKNCSHPTIVDLGTGSGNIAVSLAKFLPQAKIYAIDLSEPALKLAYTNACRHNVLNRITFLKGDLTVPLQNIGLNEKIDLFVSNPPYIATEEIPTLSQEVQKEPVSALDGGPSGLNFYQKIFRQAFRYLKTSGYLIVEIGAGQRNDIEKLLKVNGYLLDFVHKDYSGWERILAGRK